MHNFEQGRPDQVFLRVGRNDVYELNAAGGCSDMDFANRMALLPDGGDGLETVWRCPTVEQPPVPGDSIGDCHVNTALPCAEAANLFVDDMCTEPAPCVP